MLFLRRSPDYVVRERALWTATMLERIGNRYQWMRCGDAVTDAALWLPTYLLL